MQEYILPFLAKHRQLSLEGIGTFYKKVEEPVWDPVQQQFSNPAHTISFETQASNTSELFISYVAKKQGISKDEVVKAVVHITTQEHIDIEGVGNLQKDGAAFKFIQAQEQHLQKVDAPRAINNESHEMLVGDNVVTNEVMQEFLHEYPEAKTSRWSWKYTALLIAGFAIAYLVFYHINQH